jgi:lipoyl(octanoyl) transferase
MTAEARRARPPEKESPGAAPLPWSYLGRMAYAPARALQERRRDAVLANEAGEHLFLLEHEPVITLGRSARREHVLSSDGELARRGVELVRTSRGGDVTYHGPGQLMIYPVVRLRTGVAEFLAELAGALADVAAALGVCEAAWRRDPAGLWLGDEKLAACGIHLRRRVTSHGFAFDVATPPAAWQAIVPCGLAGARVISLDRARRARGLPPAPPVAELAPRVAEAIARRLGRRAEPTS